MSAAMNDDRPQPAGTLASTAFSEPDLAHGVTRWLLSNFHARLVEAVAGTPFTVPLLCAIACREAGLYWLPLTTHKTPAELLGLCVYDASGDVAGTQRSAFPANTAEFRLAYGEAFTAMLVAEANAARTARGLVPATIVYKGYGIFQYDLQYVREDEAFFRLHRWYDFGECLSRAIGELKKKYSGDIQDTIRAYNGSGTKAEEYARDVMRLLPLCEEAATQQPAPVAGILSARTVSVADGYDDDPAAPGVDEVSDTADFETARVLANLGHQSVQLAEAVGPAGAAAALNFDIAPARAFLDACRNSTPRVTYGLGKKVPFPGAVPGRDFQQVDCSGFVREAIRRSTNPVAQFPDGSVTQHDWIRANGFERSSVVAAKAADGVTRIAFLRPQDSASRIGHVVLVNGAKTLESHGGVGPDQRVWDGAGWQAKAFVYILASAPQPAAATSLMPESTSLSGSFTVRHSHRYQATVRLSGLEQLASNDLIADKFIRVGFADVTATGSGSARQVRGRWNRADTTASLDPHIVDVRELPGTSGMAMTQSKRSNREASLTRITINGISIDPAKQVNALAAANLVSKDAGGSNFILIQTSGPLTSDQRTALESLGVVILEYVPENTYICKYVPTNLDPIRSLPFVQWVNVYMKTFKVSPSLRPAAPANVFSLAPTDTHLSKDPVTVDVVLHKDIPADSVKDAVATAAGVDPNTLQVGQNKIRLTTQKGRLDAIAGLDDVRHVEQFVPPRLFNDVARKIMTADRAQAGGQFLGKGQIICVCDTGFDIGQIANVHPAFTGRVTKLYALGRNIADDPAGHGTHVCGSALGDSTSVDGTLSIKGTAPAAALVMQSVLDQNNLLGGIPSDLHDLFLPPYQNDQARIHTNSWGSNVQGAYTSYSHDVDDFVVHHRDCLICFAAGNAGKDGQGTGQISLGSVGSPATAKNCLAVGASENDRPNFSLAGSNHPLEYGSGWPNDFPAPPINGDPVGDNIDGMAAFSSRGPATNMRVRPDVVAPGTAVLSTKSRSTNSTGWLDYDALHFYDGGTSMATPLVAGCAAVVREYLVTRQQKSPSAALIKAMLINGATPMKGQYPAEVGSPPDNSQGFGRIDLAATVGPYPAGTQVNYVDESNSLVTGQSEQVQLHIVAGCTLKVTLVWSDLPGEALQNDLDLVVTLPDGSEWHGNLPAGASGYDRTNNVEQVMAPNAVDGDATITVRAYRTIEPQSYALVTRVF